MRHFYWHNAQWNRSFSSVVWIKASARLHKLCKRMTRVCKSDKFAYFMWFKFLSRFCNKISNSSISYMCFWCVLGRVTGSCSVPTSGKPLRCLFNVYVLNLLTYLRSHLHHCIRYLSMFREDAVAFCLKWHTLRDVVLVRVARRMSRNLKLRRYFVAFWSRLVAPQAPCNITWLPGIPLVLMLPKFPKFCSIH